MQEPHSPRPNSRLAVAHNQPFLTVPPLSRPEAGWTAVQSPPCPLRPRADSGNRKRQHLDAQLRPGVAPREAGSGGAAAAESGPRALRTGTGASSGPRKKSAAGGPGAAARPAPHPAPDAASPPKAGRELGAPRPSSPPSAGCSVPRLRAAPGARVPGARRPRRARGGRGGRAGRRKRGRHAGGGRGRRDRPNPRPPAVRAAVSARGGAETRPRAGGRSSCARP